MRSVILFILEILILCSVLHIALSSLPTGQPSYGIYEQISIEPKYLLLYVESMIKCHNKYRYLHGSPKLRHDPKLTREAFKFADVLARTNIFKHDSLLSKFTGENLCKIRIDTNDVVHAIYKHLLNDSAKACHGWYCQSIHYDSEKEHKTRKQILHFTQLIWKSSKKVGFGMSGIQRTNYIGNKRWFTIIFFMVARYSPAGNIIGRFKDNVFPRRSYYNTPEICRKEKGIENN